MVLCGLRDTSQYFKGENIMSFRPTISVYIGGKIVDFGYYRNWDDTDLLYEAIAIVAFFGDCKTREEYYNRKFGCQDVVRVLEPEVFSSSEKDLAWLETHSEFPIIIDFTKKCIYVNHRYGLLSDDELQKKPSILDDLEYYGYTTETKRAVKKEKKMNNGKLETVYSYGYVRRKRPVTELQIINLHTDFYLLLKNCKIPYDQLNMEEIRSIILKWPKAKYHISSKMIDYISKMELPKTEST